MARTTFTGPVKSLNGFEGTTLGNFTITEGGNTITTTNTATSGTYQPLVVSTTMSGAGADGGRSKFDMTTNVALGSFSNALKAEVTYGATGRTTGLGSAFVAEMTLSAGTSSGTYAPLEIELNAPTGASTGTRTSFIHISTQGAAVGTVDDNAVFFNLQGVSPAAGHLWKTGTNLGTAAGALRVRIGTTNYWMPVYAAEPT
jgi:hypothetical protein